MCKIVGDNPGCSSGLYLCARVSPGRRKMLFVN